MIYCSTNLVPCIGGNLGNQLMRVMALMEFSKKYNIPWAIPFWPYAKYFENEIPQQDGLQIATKIQEPCFHYAGPFFDGVDWGKDVDLRGYFQSPRYWIERLRFKKGYLSGLKRKYDFSKNPIAISVRRGDFVGHKCYYQLPIEYYVGALIEHFADFPARSIFIFSDDLNWCREQFWLANSVHFIEASDIEQLAVMTLCSDFIISQSTFSYMGAFLADRGKVVRPLKNFDGEFAKKNSEKDFWPKDDRWVIYDFEKEYSK